MISYTYALLTAGAAHLIEPAMLLVPAALLVGVALVPGMPNFAFAFVGLTLFAAAWVAMARAPRVAPGGEGLRVALQSGPESGGAPHYENSRVR